MLISLAKLILRAARRFRLRLAGAHLEAPRLLAADIGCRRGVGAMGSGQIDIGAGAWIEQGVVLHAYGGKIRIGRDVFLGPHTVIYGHGGVEIGDECLIAMHCRILSSNHSLGSFGTPVRTLPDIMKPTRIGRDVWLGAGVTVLGGVTIGDGCVVGAGAVVTKDLAPGAIAFGVPAVAKNYREGSPPHPI